MTSSWRRASYTEFTIWVWFSGWAIGYAAMPSPVTIFDCALSANSWLEICKDFMLCLILPSIWINVQHFKSETHPQALWRNCLHFQNTHRITRTMPTNNKLLITTLYLPYFKKEMAVKDINYEQLFIKFQMNPLKKGTLNPWTNANSIFKISWFVDKNQVRLAIVRVGLRV